MMDTIKFVKNVVKLTMIIIIKFYSQPLNKEQNLSVQIVKYNYVLLIMLKYKIIEL